MPKPKLSLVAQQGITELRRDHGIEPTLDEIIWLHELGKAQEVAGRIDGIVEGPVQAGKVFLWPMTILAAQWYSNYASKWFGSSPLFSFYSLAFVLAHGRGQAIPDTRARGWCERVVRHVMDIHESRTLIDLNDRNEAAAAIERWIADSGATRIEMETAVDYLLASADEKPADKNDLDQGDDMFTAPPGLNYDDIVHQLAALSGVDPEYWRSRTSKDATFRAYTNVIQIEQARRGSSGPPVADALTEAIRRFRRAIVAIINAHKVPEAAQGVAG